MPKKQKTFAIKLTLVELRYCLIALRTSKRKEEFLLTRSKINQMLITNDEFYIPLQGLDEERNDLKLELYEEHDSYDN